MKTNVLTTTLDHSLPGRNTQLVRTFIRRVVLKITNAVAVKQTNRMFTVAV